MAVLTFFEKQGCLTNHEQKRLLRKAGLSLEVKNLLRQPWTQETLRPYFQGLAVKDWLNPNAPALKQGTVVVDSLEADQVLAMMITDPILIRRPLMVFNGKHMAGFDREILRSRFGIELNLDDDADNAESCSNSSTVSCVP